MPLPVRLCRLLICLAEAGSMPVVFFASLLQAVANEMIVKAMMTLRYERRCFIQLIFYLVCEEMPVVADEVTVDYDACQLLTGYAVTKIGK